MWWTQSTNKNMFLFLKIFYFLKSFMLITKTQSRQATYNILAMKWVELHCALKMKTLNLPFSELKLNSISKLCLKTSGGGRLQRCVCSGDPVSCTWSDGATEDKQERQLYLIEINILSKKQKQKLERLYHGGPVLRISMVKRWVHRVVQYISQYFYFPACTLNRTIYG